LDSRDSTQKNNWMLWIKVSRRYICNTIKVVNSYPIFVVHVVWLSWAPLPSMKCTNSYLFTVFFPKNNLVLHKNSLHFAN
jgi:hypothetical protein